MAARGDITCIVKKYDFEKFGEVLVEQNKIVGEAVLVLSDTKNQTNPGQPRKS